VSGSEAAALVESRNQLEKQVEAQDKAKASAEQLSGAIASSLTDSLRGLVTGSMSAEEALANAFQGIADAFLDMAFQMIQQWLQMQILGILTGGGGGGLFGGGGFSFFANGGYVTGPTNAIIGEAGESEYVIPASKMGSAMSNYSMGKRGGAVLDETAEGGGAGGGGEQTFRLETTVINGVEYATVDQVRAMGDTAAKRGAAAGRSQTLGTLRNSRSQRARLGM